MKMCIRDRGGVLGRTLLLLFLQEGIRTLFFSGLPFRRRLRETGRMAVDSVSGVVPYLRAVSYTHLDVYKRQQ